MMIPLAGFAPDADTTTPGILTDCSNFIPYLNGMEGAPSAVTPASTPALSGACLGSSVVTNLSGVRRLLAGTATGIYELSAGVWTDRTRAAGAYSGSTDTRWMFAQFGDATLAANRNDTIQRSLSGVFSDVAGAPKAEIVFSVGSFVMALNTNDGAEKADGWHCCAAFDDTDWTPSVTTQATRGRLVSTPGPIMAGMRLGEYAVAYKTKAVYLGQYVGAPDVWDWVQVPGGEAGCVGKEAVCDIGGAHFFVGNDNFWIFDGTRPVPLADNVLRQWFYDNSNPSYLYRTKAVFDRHNNRVWIFYPSANSSTCDAALVYHVQTKKWGRADQGAEAVLSYIAPGLTIDQLSTVAATIDTLPPIGFDSQYWFSGGQSLSIFNTSHQLQMLTGVSTGSSFVTGHMGDDDAITLLQGVRLRFAPGYTPSAATLQSYFKRNMGDADSAGQAVSMQDGKFDVIKSARWHKGAFSFTGPARVTGINVLTRPAGKR